MGFYEDVIDWIARVHPDKDALSKYKVVLAKEHGLGSIPTDINILLHCPKELLERVRPFVVTKPARTGSGVAVVATMTASFACPHGSCTYCPGGPGSVFGDTPKSYTGKEPSTMRGARHDFDPYRIIFNRLEQYVVLGHSPEKVEQIIMGGTFCALPEEYQDEYVYFSFKAYNDFSRLFYRDGVFLLDRFKEFFELPGEVGNPGRAERIRGRVLALREVGVRSLAEEQLENETAAIRCIGLTVETKPDWGRAEQGLRLLRYGVTRVELGVQTVYDEVLDATHRGHDDAETRSSMAELRDLGFKLNIHMMPGLPGLDGKRISRERDVASLKAIFEDEGYRPDMLKVYPCMVMPGTPLEEEFRAGIFVPLSTAEAADIIVEMKRSVPEWCRIMRVQRDIPTFATSGGVDRTNLRQEVFRLAEERGVRCRCIRCREVGRKGLDGEPRLVVREYVAGGASELFISFETDEALLGFVRLRLPARSLIEQIDESTGVIRELHVYGPALSLGDRDEAVTQHRGVGRLLMDEAEAIAWERGRSRMIVISGVGVREYYARRGYVRDGPYMACSLPTVKR